MAKRKKLNRLEIGTVVLDPVVGVWGNVCANRETVRFGGTVVREVQVRLANSFWRDAGPDTPRRVWYRLRLVRMCGVYAVVMPACTLLGTKPGPDARMRQGVPVEGSIARLFEVRQEDCKPIVADSTLDQMERTVEYDDPQYHPGPQGAGVASVPQTWAGETA